MSGKSDNRDTLPESAGHPLLDPELRRIAIIIGFMLIAAGAVGALALMWPFLAMVARTTLPFAIALVFAYVFDPVVTFVQRKLKMSRAGGVLLLYLLFIAAFTAFFAIVLPILIEQVQSAYHGIFGLLSNWLHRASIWIGTPEGQSLEEIRKSQHGIVAVLWEQLSQWASTQGIAIESLFQQAAHSSEVRSAAQNAASSGIAVVGDALTFLFSILLHFVGGAAFLVLAVLVNIYLLFDFSKLRDVLEIFIPARYEKRTFEVLHEVDKGVGGFIRGSLLVACIVGTLIFAGLYLLGLRQYALLIGIVAGLGNLVPYLGAIMGTAPAMLYIFFSDAYTSFEERMIRLAGLIVLYTVVQSLDGFVLQPKIVGKSAQLHPVAVLFALAFGANFGIVGMILAVPTACIVRILLKELYWNERQSDWARRSGKRFLGDWNPPKKRKA